MNIIITAITDENYIPLAINWYKSIQRTTKNIAVKLYCLDKNSVDIAKTHNIPCTRINSEIKCLGDIPAVKSRIISELIEGYDFIVMSDTDIVFNDDISNSILSDYTAVDFVGSRVSLPDYHICGGFYLIKSSSTMKEFFDWSYIADFEDYLRECNSIKRHGGGWDEACINYQLGIYPEAYNDVYIHKDKFKLFSNIKYASFPPEKYKVCQQVPGHRWRKRRNLYRRLFNESSMLHFAFQKGLANKIRAMKISGGWYNG